VFAAPAESSLAEDRTGWSIRKIVRAAVTPNACRGRVRPALNLRSGPSGASVTRHNSRG
jgi:hypothetical protein